MQRILCLIFALIASTAVLGDPLPSWRDTENRKVIMDFVQRVTDPEHEDFVKASERIAVFDNDGTLWAEQPFYFQGLFAFDRIREMAPDHPDWAEQTSFKAVIEHDIPSIKAMKKETLLDLALTAHGDLNTDQFSEVVTHWLAVARHPTTGRAYTDMVYQPMLELLEYLRSQGFKTFIVSGGGTGFIRTFSEPVYGIPPEQVVGSSVQAKYRSNNGQPFLEKVPQLWFINDGPGKPVGIHQHIGRRPLLAVGNSDGDFEMLEWTSARQGPSLSILIHHDDDQREWAYDKNSGVGRLNRGLGEAADRGWLLVSMKQDWNRIFPQR
ncbi:HAD family hydrolase [Ferrimonas marina]|uniref:Phosphoserine phosphatase n=1 Tax=Ferrimonas marina TaxID=299255 RepID=A0A1M5ND21_9GAMM|nr:HAD family hydrolase [Ferrimonas marina]SHG86873.1 Phosphoserine phosphatase [Ferrimonas marina]